MGAWQDGRTTKIKVSYLWLGGFIGIICGIMDVINDKTDPGKWGINLLPGMLFLIYAKTENKKIGDADGWILVILGFCFSGMRLWPVFNLSILLLLIFSIFLLVTKKGDKKTEIPYLPFLWMADTILWGLEYVS